MPAPRRCVCVLSPEQALLPFSVLVSQPPAAFLTAAFCAAALKACARSVCSAICSAGSQLRVACFLATVSHMCLDHDTVKSSG